MTDSARPPAGTIATPPLGQPAATPGAPPAAGSAPTLPGPASPAYGPAPTLQGVPPPPGMNPYQSQPFYPPTSTPVPGTQPPPRPDRGTMPAIAVAAAAPPPVSPVTAQMPSHVPKPPTIGQVTPQMPGVAPNPPVVTGPQAVAPRPQPYPSAGAQRIMVQYPQEGSKLNGQRGTYEVRSVIGSGEFGAVYECIGPFDQIYAVKMVRPSNRPYSEVHAEWAREVQRLFTLRHPNVVYIYDSFTQDHLFYLALEKCDHALKVMLGPPMQEGLVLEMSRQLLAAVQFLHDNDIVHDDLHAGNVLITHTDRPTVKISDFGISHELRGMTAVRPNVVHHAIMAPEILATGYTSRQSDLYQVGLLMYWMLTGEPAIQMDVPYQELVRQVAEGEPRQRAESLATPLGHLIAKMLRRREAFRYTSAKEVWADLRELPAWKERDLFPTR